MTARLYFTTNAFFSRRRRVVDAGVATGVVVEEVIPPLACGVWPTTIDAFDYSTALGRPDNDYEIIPNILKESKEINK